MGGGGTADTMDEKSAYQKSLVRGMSGPNTDILAKDFISICSPITQGKFFFYTTYKRESKQMELFQI